MSANPLEHVLDSDKWALFESMEMEWDLRNLQVILVPTKFMLLELVAAGLVILFCVPLARRVANGDPPRGAFWNAIECLLTFVREQVAKPYLGEHEADRYVPFLWTLFLFILFNNLLGMFPFMGSPTASLSVTLALAICSFVAIHGSAIAKMGVGHYLQSFIPHVEVPFGMGYFLVPMIVTIEVMGHFIKAFVLAVRLFANMFAGHTVLAVLLSFIVMASNASIYIFVPITLASVLGVTLLSLLELFVAFLQAFIFTFLTTLFMGSVLHPEH